MFWGGTFHFTLPTRCVLILRVGKGGHADVRCAITRKPRTRTVSRPTCERPKHTMQLFPSQEVMTIVKRHPGNTALHLQTKHELDAPKAVGPTLSLT
jgi:hypothetical protein